ncbi:MAG: TetR family transcriptional regulator [Alphaproteobacteria bacterium]|nr:TetR family transcriptional regulator [Alphaproteobacteria bacterium]
MPKQVDHDEQRSAIAHAALRVIARVGIESATMRGIAAEADCTTGLLTHYFSSRDDLIDHALVAAHTEFFHQLDREITHGKNGRDALLRALVVMSNVPSGSDQSVLLHEMATVLGDTKARRRLAELYGDVEQRLTGQAARAADDTSLVTSWPARDLVHHLTATAEGLYMAAIARPQVFTVSRRRALLDAALDAAASGSPSHRKTG